MKKLSIVVTVVFFLVLLLSACGGKSASVVKPTAENKVTSSNKTANSLGVSGKSCPKDMTKLTAADLADAAVITVCQRTQIQDLELSKAVDEVFPKGKLAFTALSQDKTNTDGSVVLSFRVEVTQCSDCPRQFYGTLALEKNAVVQWQESENYSGYETVTENEESYHQAILRRVNIVFFANQFDIPPGESSFTVPIAVKGDPMYVLLQGQVGDGRVLEFESSPPPDYVNFQVYSGNASFPNGTHVKLISYSFNYKGFVPVWIPLNNK